MQRREVLGASSLDQYLADAEKKYTAESKVADLMTLQQFLRDRIAVETALVETFGCPDTAAEAAAGGEGAATTRGALLQSVVAVESVVKRIKNAFRRENMKLPPEERFPPPTGAEIRQKLRERSGAPAALAAGVAVPNPETWHARRGALGQLVEKRKKLVATLDEARANLLRMQGEQSQRAGLDDNTVSAISADVSPSSDLNTANFDTYGALHCCDECLWFPLQQKAHCLLLLQLLRRFGSETLAQRRHAPHRSHALRIQSGES